MNKIINQLNENERKYWKILKIRKLTLKMSTKCTSGLLLLSHVEGLVAILRGVEVVDAGRVGGEGHVGQTRLGVLLEEL